MVEYNHRKYVFFCTRGEQMKNGNLNEIFERLYIKHINKTSTGKIFSSKSKIIEEILQETGTKYSSGWYDDKVRNLDLQEMWEESRLNLPVRDEGDYGVKEKDGLFYGKTFIELSVETKSTPEEIMLSHGYDPNEWVIVEAGSTGSKIGTKANDEQYFINRYNRIKVRPKEAQELSHQELVKLITESVEPLKPMLFDSKDSSQAFEVDFFDIHVNSDGYSRKAIKHKVEKMRKYIINNDIERVKIVFGGDYLHVNTTNERTVNDTQLKLIGTAYEMIREGELLARYIIDRLSVVDTKIFWVLGNHSDLPEYQLFDKLEQLYSLQKHIEFFNDESPYKAYVYGKQFVMLSHGNISLKEIQNLPSQRFPKLWAEATAWEVHLGHIHHENVKSFGSLVVRYQRTPKATDSWEYYKGWFNNLQHIQAYTIDKIDGIIGTHYF